MKIGLVADDENGKDAEAILGFIAPFLDMVSYDAEIISPQNTISGWKDFDLLILFMDIRKDFNRKHFFHFVQKVKNQIPIVNDPDLWLWESDPFRFYEYERVGVAPVQTLVTDSLKSFTEACGMTKSSQVVTWGGSDRKNFFTAGSDELFEYATSKFASEQKVAVQEYVPSITTEGVYSFVFFSGEFSHSIKRLGKEIFKHIPSKEEMQTALYSLNATRDLCVEKYYPGFHVRPFIIIMDFVKENNRILLLNQKFFSTRLFIPENPMAAAKLSAAVISQINFFSDL